MANTYTGEEKPKERDRKKDLKQTGRGGEREGGREDLCFKERETVGSDVVFTLSNQPLMVVVCAFGCSIVFVEESV